MLLLASAIITVFAFAALWRALGSAAALPVSRTLLIGAGTALALGTGILVASGRLPWFIGLAIAVLPFARMAFAGRRIRSQPSRFAAEDDMSVDRALAVLGLTPGADAAAVIDAHRKLMQKLHPDRGGSTYLAQQLNEAKRVLLHFLDSRT